MGMLLLTGLFAAATGAVGFAVGAAGQLWIGLLVVRSLMGFSTAPLHPGTARTVGFWVPGPRQGLANGLAVGAALVGIASTYMLFGWLIDRFDWPTAFLITGSTTILLSVVWAVCATDRPGQHRSVNQAERVAIGEPPVAVATKAPTAKRKRLLSRNLLLLTASYSALDYFQYLFFYWIHYYFDTVLQLGQDQSRLYASLPNYAMAIGMPLGGVLTDWLDQKLGVRRGRWIVPAGGLAISAVLLVGGILTRDIAVVVTLFTLSFGILGATEAPSWKTAVEIGGTRGGAAAAIMNTGGNGVGLLAPVLSPAIGQLLGWQWGFGFAAIVSVLGALCWIWIDPLERADETA